MTEEIEKRIKTSIDVADSLWRDVKIVAAKKGLKLFQVVEVALQHYVELSEKEAEKKAKKE